MRRTPRDNDEGATIRVRYSHYSRSKHWLSVLRGAITGKLRAS